MPWFGVVWNESYGFLRRGCWDCYLVTVILVVWFIYLKIVMTTMRGNSRGGRRKKTR